MRQGYPPTAESCAQVRRDLTAFLDGWGVDDATVESSVMVANELACNAVDHARTPFHMVATLTPGSVRIELTDGAATEPQLQVHDVHAARGRGLQMVAALASAWTFHRHGTGKTVVADIAVDHPVGYR
ncbi:ATP-binding protein [Pseudonocardia pini]|uniref:ATP-binding protein n=1 Tax=Pseudonocardia pini TaxID=2758030 RepID=UPI0015EFEAAF|nr:ATP-binding protein [Pseudonocardia pini]